MNREKDDCLSVIIGTFGIYNPEFLEAIQFATMHCIWCPCGKCELIRKAISKRISPKTKYEDPILHKYLSDLQSYVVSMNNTTIFWEMLASYYLDNKRKINVKSMLIDHNKIARWNYLVKKIDIGALPQQMALTGCPFHDWRDTDTPARVASEMCNMTAYNEVFYSNRDAVWDDATIAARMFEVRPNSFRSICALFPEPSGSPYSRIKIRPIVDNTRIIANDRYWEGIQDTMVAEIEKRVGRGPIVRSHSTREWRERKAWEYIILQSLSVASFES